MFSQIAVGARFWDPLSGEFWIKVDETTARCAGGGDALEGETDHFNPDDPTEVA